MGGGARASRGLEALRRAAEAPRRWPVVTRGRLRRLRPPKAQGASPRASGGGQMARGAPSKAGRRPEGPGARCVRPRDGESSASDRAQCGGGHGDGVGRIVERPGYTAQVRPPAKRGDQSVCTSGLSRVLGRARVERRLRSRGACMPTRGPRKSSLLVAANGERRSAAGGGRVNRLGAASSAVFGTSEAMTSSIR